MHRVWLWIHPLRFLTVLYIFLGVLAFGIHFILLSTERFNWLAERMIALGATEALNLDGGGSSCLLVMGRETIKPSD